MNQTLYRWSAAGLGAALLLGTTTAISLRAMAGSDEPSGKKPGVQVAQAQPGGGGQPGDVPRRPGGPGGFGGPGFGGGFPGGPGGGFPGMMGGMGGVQMTATSTNVFILRGNTLYSFDARSLKLLGKAELPAPEPPAGGFGPGGFPGGGGGFGGPGGAGRPGGRPGGAPNDPN